MNGNKNEFKSVELEDEESLSEKLDQVGDKLDAILSDLCDIGELIEESGKHIDRQSELLNKLKGTVDDLGGK